MNKKCRNCGLVNFAERINCSRCNETLEIPPSKNEARSGAILLRRAMILAIVCLTAVAGFYVSLIFSAQSLSSDQREIVGRAIAIIETKGFADEAFLLRHVGVFRANDNWLNASVEKENAFAATNFPFEIVTLYPDFFTYPADDVERAAILLHEAKHLQGRDEPHAYEFVWKNRKRLGWTADLYGQSEVWLNVRRQTRDYAPRLFVCEFNPNSDCTD